METQYDVSENGNMNRPLTALVFGQGNTAQGGRQVSVNMLDPRADLRIASERSDINRTKRRFLGGVRPKRPRA